MKIKVKKYIQLTGHRASVYSLTQGKEPHLILSGSGDGWVVEWNLNDPELGRLVAKAEANIFSLFENKDLIVAGNMNGGIHWIYPNELERNKDIAHHQKGVFDIQLFDNHLFTTGGKGILTKWSMEERRPVLSLHVSARSLRQMAFSKKRNEIAVGASDTNIYILDANTFDVKEILEDAHDHSVFTVKYSTDGKYLLSGGRDAHLKVWEIENKYKRISSQPAHYFTINDIAFHPDGKIFATASRDKTIKIWSLQDFKLLKVLDVARDGGHINSVNSLLWTTHHNWLVSGSDDRSLIIWEVEEL